MSNTGNSQIETGGPPPAAHSAEGSKVRTLHEPPDIWELVHETREEFKPGSTFFGHLKALHPLVLFMILLVAGGGGVFGVMKYRVWSESGSTTPTVPAETSKSVLSPPPAQPNQTLADQSTIKAPARTEPAVTTVDQPKTAPAAPAASSENKVSAASSDSNVTVKPRPQSSPKSATATGEAVAARKKEKAQATKLTTAASPTKVRTDNKDGNQALPTPAPKSDKQPAADPPITKKEPDKAQSPQLTPPAKASATPKPKVIPWP